MCIRDSFNVIGSETESYLTSEGTALGDTFPDANMILDFGGFEAAAIRTGNTIEMIGVDGGALAGGFGLETQVNLDDTLSLPNDRLILEIVMKMSSISPLPSEVI